MTLMYKSMSQFDLAPHACFDRHTANWKQCHPLSQSHFTRRCEWIFLEHLINTRKEDNNCKRRNVCANVKSVALRTITHKRVVEYIACWLQQTAHTHTHTHTHAHTRTHTHTHTHTHTNTHTQTQTQTNAHTHTPPHTHTLTQTHTNTYDC